ncbi:MAG: hypothetical protein AAFR84_11715 [Pseudomonadota bacterium]
MDVGDALVTAALGLVCEEACERVAGAMLRVLETMEETPPALVPHRGELPLLAAVGARYRGEISPNRLHRLEALALRERSRSAIVAAQRGAVADVIRTAGLTPRELRGWPLATAAYPEPELRHAGRITMLLLQETHPDVMAGLAAEGWNLACPLPAFGQHQRRLLGPQKVAVELQARRLPWMERAPWDIEGPSETEGDAAECLLADVLARRVWEPFRKGRRWMIDTALLVNAAEPDIEESARMLAAAGCANIVAQELRPLGALVPRPEKQLADRLEGLRRRLAECGADHPAARDIHAVSAAQFSFLRLPLVRVLRNPGLLADFIGLRALRREQRQGQPPRQNVTPERPLAR